MTTNFIIRLAMILLVPFVVILVPVLVLMFYIMAEIIIYAISTVINSIHFKGEQ